MKHPDTVSFLLSQSNDPSRANRYLGVTHMFQCVKTIRIVSGSDYITIKFFAGIQIMVVGIKTGILQFVGLFMGEHPQRTAYFHPHGAHTFYHVEYLVEVAVVTHLTPCC